MTLFPGTESRPLAATLAASLALVLAATWAVPAVAQTPFNGQGGAVSRTPPGRSTGSRAPSGAQQQASAANTTTASPAMPVPDSVIKQAEQQLNGNFPAMARSGVGGQVQDAWNKSEASEGVHTFRLCENCVYKVRLREFMVTTILLPEDAHIVTADLGDTAGFQVKVRAANMLAVRPASYGLDTSLNVYTKSGAIYPIYLRAESFNSVNVPDLVVKIVGQETPKDIEGPKPSHRDDEEKPVLEDGSGRQGKEGTDRNGKPGNDAAKAVAGLTNPKADDGDFVKSVPFDPSKLHGWKDYELWGDDELRPEAVFRDDRFTYIQYTPDQWAALELPTGYVVIDEVDELVNSRVQGTTFIIESVSPLISLKSGLKFLCIKYTGGRP